MAFPFLPCFSPRFSPSWGEYRPQAGEGGFFFGGSTATAPSAASGGTSPQGEETGGEGGYTCVPHKAL